MVDRGQIERYVKVLYGQARGHEDVHAFVTAIDPAMPGREKRVATRKAAVIIAHAERHDIPGRGVYACVNMLKASEQERSKDNLGLLVAIHVDLDFKDITASESEAISAISSLPITPTIAIHSGNGLHLYWVLSDPLEATIANVEVVESLNHRIADVLGAAPSTRDVSRLLRVPGTHNTKRGDNKPVFILNDVGCGMAADPIVHDVDDLDEWLSVQSPVIGSREAPFLSRGEGASNPFLETAKLLGYKPSIQVEQRLAAMSFGAAGDASIHQTQLQVTASLLSRGQPVNDVVDLVLAATRGAAGSAGERWNWRREENGIRRMCQSWLSKNPPETRPAPRIVSETPPQETAEAKETQEGAQASAKRVSNGADVVHLDERREKKVKAKSKSADTPLHIIVGQTVLATMQERGVAVIFTDKGAWRYSAGVWWMATDGLRGWLDVEIERACRGVGIETTNRLVSETRAYVTRSPDLWRDEVDWDAHGKIPTLSGLVDPLTLHVEPMQPEHFCTWRVDVEYDPAANCPWWEMMIGDTFSDRPAALQAENIGVIQEMAGAGLIDGKPKALSKALVLVGGSNAGKSALLDVLGGMHGKDPIAAGLESLEGSHGLMSFTRRAPWVLHEAFDQSKWHFSSAVKAIIEGKPVHINVKNGPMLNQRIRSPIFWGTNYPPQFREATRAIVNRMVIVNCHREFAEGQYVGAGVEAARLGFDSPADLVLAQEMPGVLNWAIRGLQRAQKRGYIELNDEMRETADDIHRDSNLAAGFIEECIEFDDETRLSVPDFCAAFSVWWVENKGETRHAPSNESIGKAVVALSDARIAYHPKDLRDNRRRYYAGIRLNEGGMEFWHRAVESDMFQGKTTSTTDKDKLPNSSIPSAWEDRPSILAMRKAFRVRRSRESRGPAQEHLSQNGRVSSEKTTDTVASITDTFETTDTDRSDTDWPTDTELTPHLTRDESPRGSREPLF